MFGRIFGRGKDEPDQAVCASCGRTLLAGEWTQQIVDDNGEEKFICSLCGQSRPLGEGQRGRSTTTPANAGRVRESRSESDAFWKALKDKDLEIERLQALLARAEAEKQELLGRMARSRGQEPAEAEAQLTAEHAGAAAVVAAAAAADPAQVVVADDVVIEAESWTATSAAPIAQDETPELAAATWGETPDELAAALAEFDAMQPAAQPQAQARPSAFEDTQPIPTAELEAEDGATPSAAAPAAAGGATDGKADDDPAVTASRPEQVPNEADLRAREAAAAEAQREAEAAARREAEAAASLTLLQRGVDLLNVSNVPRKIAETNEHLGLPSVHVGFDGQVVAVTFLWTMGWYRFIVDIESGAVKMHDRGYEERADLQPNAGVRADGTVHLAPAQISRAAAARAAAEPAVEPAPAPSDEPTPAGGGESPSAVAQKAPEFVSKSLLGQRSDDEANPWDGTAARDFNWDR